MKGDNIKGVGTDSGELALAKCEVTLHAAPGFEYLDEVPLGESEPVPMLLSQDRQVDSGPTVRNQLLDDSQIVIAYNIKESQFLGPCETALHEQGSTLDAGGVVPVTFEKTGSYDYEITVVISDKDPERFTTNWRNSDPSRFPARIKAAATALRNCGRTGSYRVRHVSGSLQIQRL